MVLGMPNWSYTYYTLTGDAVQLKELYEVMSELGNADTPNDPRWLGYLVEWLYGDNDKFLCRGFWSDLELIDDGSLRFSVIHAWRHPEYLEDLIRSRFNKLYIYYQEQEPEAGVFSTNDLRGEHYPETIFLDAGGNIDYYVGEDVFTDLSKLSGKTISTWEEAFDFVNSNDEIQILEIEYDQRGPEPREVKFYEFNAGQYKVFLRNLIGTLSDSEIESTYLKWGQEGVYNSDECIYGNLEGGKDRLIAAVEEIPLEDMEGLFMKWNYGYVETESLSKGKYLSTVNIYQ